MGSVISKQNGGSIFIAIAVGGVLAMPTVHDAQSRQRESCSRITPGNAAYCCPNVSPYRGATRPRPGYAEKCAFGYYAPWDERREFTGRGFFTPDRPINLAP